MGGLKQRFPRLVEVAILRLCTAQRQQQLTTSHGIRRSGVFQCLERARILRGRLFMGQEGGSLCTRLHGVAHSLFCVVTAAGNLKKVISQFRQHWPGAGWQSRRCRGPRARYRVETKALLQHGADLAMRLDPLGSGKVSIERFTDEGMSKAVATQRMATFGDDLGRHRAVEQVQKLIMGHAADTRQRLQVKCPPDHAGEHEDAVTWSSKCL